MTRLCVRFYLNSSPPHLRSLWRRHGPPTRYAMAMSRAEALYDRDLFEWTQENARLLEEGWSADTDLVHIAEELEHMGKRDQRAVENRLEVLIRHLLKWQIRPEKRSASWEVRIGTQRS